jgi:hypothetical protein
MLKLQKFLKHHSIDELINKYSIIVKIHEEYPNLFQFKYNQIKSPLSKKIVQECRGIILDRQQDWKVICMTYSKFFNYGEPNASFIIWKKAKCIEKIDGSLIQLYYYRNKWHVATSGTPNGNANIELGNTTFKYLFWKVWNELNYSLPLNTNLCYAFELTTPYNKIVVQHKTNDIKLHGVRDINTLKELEYKDIAIKNNWDYAQEYPMTDIKSIIKISEKLNPMEAEGYVIVDNKFHRVKVKSPQYVALHHIKSQFSYKRLIEVIMSNESNEFLTYFPEYTELYEKTKYKLMKLIEKIEFIYNKIKHITDQKQFALKAVNYKNNFILFCVYKKRCIGVQFKERNKKIDNIKDCVYNLKSKYIVQMLNLGV